MASTGLSRRLLRTLLLQLGLISLATVLGIMTAKLVLEDVLIRQALAGESAHFWDNFTADPEFGLPATQNLTGYMGQVPGELQDLSPGFHNLQGKRLVMVTEKGGQRLLLVYDARRVNELAFIFGLVPLALVLLVLYLSSWLGFRASRRAISPVIALARDVRELDPEQPDPAVFDKYTGSHQVDEEGADDAAYDEVGVLAEAMQRFTLQINELIERERHFTRDASHELRSPLTVINMAVELLDDDPGLSEAGRRSLDRVRRAARDMQELIVAFLLLARESETGLESEAVSLNTLVAEEFGRIVGGAAVTTVESAIEADCELLVDAPRKVLSVMIGNLLRNAFSYTDEGAVRAVIAPGSLTIIDSGVGMTDEQLERVFQPFEQGGGQGGGQRGGYGVGLTIVRRLSDRFAWPVSIRSEPGVGTEVEIRFPEARVGPLANGEG